MFEYFYHEILRKTIISFGTLFNNITIQKKDASDTDFSVMKIPLAYGPTQKFLARLDQNLNKSTAISLPRMSFEFTGLTYDSSRKVTTTQKIAVKDPDTKKKVDKVFTKRSDFMKSCKASGKSAKECRIAWKNFYTNKDSIKYKNGGYTKGGTSALPLGPLGALFGFGKLLHKKQVGQKSMKHQKSTRFRGRKT